MKPSTRLRVYYKKGCDRNPLTGNPEDRLPFETTVSNIKLHEQINAGKIKNVLELTDEGEEIIPIQNKKPNQKFKKLD
jgi:hypothetical protein